MRIYRIILSLIISISIITTLIYGNGLLRGEKEEQTQNEREILNVWHVDGFEGGTWSRRQFLAEVSKAFERKNNVVVNISEYTVDGMENNFNQGIYPDVVSFSNGLNIDNLYRISLESSPNCQVDGKTFCVCWCKGRYALFSHTSQNQSKSYQYAYAVSQKDYTIPLLTRFENEVFSDYLQNKPLDAYVDFISGKAEYLLGTQRDVYRLNARGYSFEMEVLDGFSDLNQYLGITSKSNSKIPLAQKYLEYIISDDVQSKLYKIGLFSDYIEVEYDDENLKKLSKTKEKTTVSAFLSKNIILELQSDVKRFLSGSEQIKNNIQNLLIYY